VAWIPTAAYGGPCKYLHLKALLSVSGYRFTPSRTIGSWSACRILAGPIGANITKSLSPALHPDAFAVAGIDAARSPERQRI